MTLDEIYAALTLIFQDTFDDPGIKLRPDMTAADIRDWDSSNNLNLIIGAEIRFKLKFNMGEVEALQNVGDFADLIARRLDRQASGR